MKKKSIVLGNIAISIGNRGCGALTYCSIYLIDKVLGKGNYKLYLVDKNEPFGKGRLLILDTEVEYENIDFPTKMNFREFTRRIFSLKSTMHAFSVISKADYLMDIGLGDSFADIYGKDRFKSMDFLHRVARLFKRPYIFLPQTIGPFENERIKSKALKSIRKSAFVMARDKQSYDYVHEIAPNHVKLREYIDVAFFLPYKKAIFEKNYIHVGLNISALLWHGGYTRDNQFGLKCNYQNTIREIIKYFLSIPDVVIHLIPHVVHEKRMVENDYAVSFDLYEEYCNDRLRLSTFFLSPVDAKNYIAGLDFFMGARMHSTIAAFSSGVPVVPMAYSRKFNGLFIDTLDYVSIADMKEMTDEKILSVISGAYHDRDRLRSVIKERMDGVVEERKKILIDDLKRLLK